MWCVYGILLNSHFAEIRVIRLVELSGLLYRSPGFYVIRNLVMSIS